MGSYDSNGIYHPDPGEYVHPYLQNYYDKQRATPAVGQQQNSLASTAGTAGQTLLADKVLNGATPTAQAAGVQTLKDGSTLLADGTTVPAAGGGTPLFKMGGGSYAGYAGMVADLYGGYKNWSNKNVADKDKAALPSKTAGIMIGDYFTGGLAGAARQGLIKLTGGKWSKWEDKALNTLDPTTKIIKAFSSHKGQGQFDRDKARADLVKSGVLDPNYQLELADGSKFDMGMDGGARLKNTDGTERKYKDIDQSRTDLGNMADVYALAAPLGEISAMTSGGKDTAPTLSAYYTNAISSNAKSYDDVVNNAKHVASKFGITQDNYHSYLDALKAAGKIDDTGYKVYEAKLGQIAGPGTPTQPTQTNSDSGYTYTPPPPTKKKDTIKNYEYHNAPPSTDYREDQKGMDAYYNMIANMNKGKRNG